MDLNAIKSRLQEMESKSGNNREKVDYEKVFWRPPMGKSKIRIVPSAYDPAMPFSELKFHYNVGKYPMLALSNFGKQDPVEEFVAELKKTNDRDNWSLAGKLTPRSRFFAPVVVRGEEDMGVRIWGFSQTIFKALLSMAEDEDIGDYTDPVNGFDMNVEVRQGNPYNETSVRIVPKMTPLSDNNDLVESWLKTQPNPSEVYTQYDYNFIKKQLLEFIEPGSTDEGEEETTSIPAAPTQSTFTLETASEGKKSAVDKYDDLFDDLDD